MSIIMLSVTSCQLTYKMKNRYDELIRISHQMRKLQVSKCFGEIYSSSSPPGSLTLFCPLVHSLESISHPTGWNSQPGLLVEPLQWMAIFMLITFRCVDQILTSC